MLAPLYAEHDRWEYPSALAEREHVSAYIIIHGPGHDGTRLALREGITSFGRLPSNDVILLGDLVSRHHSRITFFEGKATLQDLGSHNGSWVNGDRVTTRVLKPNDLVRVGNFRLAFHDGPIGQGENVAYEETTAAERGESDTNAQQPVRADTVPMNRIAGSSPEPAIMYDDEPNELPDGYRSSVPLGSVLIQEIERVRAGGAEIEAKDRALLLLYKASEALSKATNLKSYIDELIALILEQIKCEYAVFLHVGEDLEADIISSRDKKGVKDDPPVSTSVVRWVTQKNFAVMTEDVAKDFRFESGPSVRAFGEEMRSVICVPVANRKRVLGALYLSRATPPFGEQEMDALSAIAHLSVVGIERAELREQAIEEGVQREALARFHSPDVVEQILKSTPSGAPPAPGLEGKTATIAFCDIQGFSSFVERLPVEEVTEFLSTYLEQMSDIILKHRGTVDKFVGASVMSIFGAPFSYGNDAARAVAASLEMRDAFDALVRARPHLGPRRLRVGIDTGWVLAGMIGTERRLEYTAIGETVTAASRLEQSAAPGAILIGEATYPLVGDVFEVRKLGLQQIRGRYEPLQVYEVVGRKRSTSRAK